MTTLRVILNGLASLKPKTGVGHYIESLHKHLQLIAPPCQLLFYPDGIAETVLRRSCRWWFDRKPLPIGHGTPGLRSRLRGLLNPPGKLLARQVAQRGFRKGFMGACARLQPDIYHEPNFLPFPTDLPTIITVHDISVLRFPQWHPADRVRAYEKHFFPGLARCKHIIAVSEFTRQELISNLGIAPDRVTAIPNGIRPHFRPLAAENYLPILRELDLSPGYLLHVGTIEPRKNLAMLMRAYVSLPNALRERHPLVLVGGWGWRSAEVKAYYQSRARAAGVRHFGYVPDGYLPALMNGAQALVCPTHYEGFGLPPVEMMACGGAVLASTAGAVAEVLHGKGTLLDPMDESLWRSCMERILTDNAWREELRSGVTELAKDYTWNRAARETWDLYQRTG